MGSTPESRTRAVIGNACGHRLAASIVVPPGSRSYAGSARVEPELAVGLAGHGPTSDGGLATHETAAMATTERRLDGLVGAVNELPFAVMALATKGQPETAPRPDAGKATISILQRVAAALSDAKPD